MLTSMLLKLLVREQYVVNVRKGRDILQFQRCLILGKLNTVRRR
jgi:hypothetical protein